MAWKKPSTNGINALFQGQMFLVPEFFFSALWVCVGLFWVCTGFCTAAKAIKQFLNNFINTVLLSVFVQLARLATSCLCGNPFLLARHAVFELKDRYSGKGAGWPHHQKIGTTEPLNGYLIWKLTSKIHHLVPAPT